MSNILALDLGSTTGFAYGPDTDITPAARDSITWATDKELREQRKFGGDRKGDIRVTRFYDWATYLDRFHNFDIVAFEDVLFSNSRAQTQLWSSFRTVLWFAFPKAKMLPVPVQTLKKFATGNGMAKKPDMAVALNGIIPEWRQLDDNAIDAIHLWRYAAQATKP